VDLRQLRYFVTVAEELHFGRAARRLAMTQPPLSQQIQALEEEIGVQLFVRTRRSVMLTPAGQQWLPEVRRVLADAAALPGLAQRLARGRSARWRWRSSARPITASCPTFCGISGPASGSPATTARGNQ
jgi:DNA-binding transcriptional LysR family regulator